MNVDYSTFAWITLVSTIVTFLVVLLYSIMAVSSKCSRDDERECCNGNCNQGRTCPVRETLAAQAGAGPRSHYRWPYGIDAHAIALAAIAAVAAFGWLFLR